MSDTRPTHIIDASDLGFHISDASDLGFPAGVWPMTFTWKSGSAEERVMARGLRTMLHDELSYVDYHAADGTIVRVYND